jgi:phospholipid/cholesterol/gamma-HCH transport system substrate-binding protein
MASQRTKFALGLFVTCGFGMIFVAVIWLGMSRYFKKGQFYTTYFNESVQGLDVDSPVKYRGVSVGRVERIAVAPDANLIEVVLKIESGQPLDKDIVAQMRSVGITGSMFIELDRKKNGDPDYSPPLSFPSKYPIVASKPSNIHKMLHNIEDALAQIKGMDLERISGKIQLTLNSINQVMADANVKGISKKIETSVGSASHILSDKRWDQIIASVTQAGESLNDIMDKTRNSLSRVENTVNRLDGITVEKEQTIKTSLEDFKQAMENANDLLKKGNFLTEKTGDSLSLLKGHFLVIAQNLEKASENLNRLIESVSDHPSQFMFGEPPMPKKVEQDEEKR